MRGIQLVFITSSWEIELGLGLRLGHILREFPWRQTWASLETQKPHPNKPNNTHKTYNIQYTVYTSWSRRPNVCSSTDVHDSCWIAVFYIGLHIWIHTQVLHLVSVVTCSMLIRRLLTLPIQVTERECSGEWGWVWALLDWSECWLPLQCVHTAQKHIILICQTAGTLL